MMTTEQTNVAVAGQNFRHFKGGLYKIIAQSTEEATGTPVVIYQNQKDARIWSRPNADFFSMVQLNNNTSVPRFTLLDPITVLFRELPLGARFTYVGSSVVWVVLRREDVGLIAKWDGNILCYVGQSICCAEDTPEKVAALYVIPV